MVTTAKPRPVPARTARPAPLTARHAGTLTHKDVTPPQLSLLVAQGTLLGCAILGILGGVVYFFGDTLRAHFVPVDMSSTAKGPAGPGPTVFYRDRGDGTVTVMEIDGNGTRIKGTMSRYDVPLLQADKVREGWGSSGINPHARVNALGSAFR
jgi:hypothetical protein